MPLCLLPEEYDLLVSPAPNKGTKEEGKSPFVLCWYAPREDELLPGA